MSRDLFPHTVLGALTERIAAIAVTETPTWVGLSGAQGSGKTTLAQELKRCLEERSLRVCVVALDDYYLTRAERTCPWNSLS